jgi:hypothetical protein
MQPNGRLDSPRWELMTAIVIAVVSLVTALAVWWTSTVASASADASRQGLIDAIKAQALTSEDWRKVYEEAVNAARYAAFTAEAEALISSDDPGAQARGENMKAYLLPNLQLVAAPLAVDPAYANADGSYDIPKRFADLQAATEGPAIDPQASFARAGRLASQHRWLVVGSVLLAVSLFWLAIAQIGRGRRRLLSFLVGLACFGTGALWFLIVGLAFAFLAGGAL